jgi:hypothetical protein
MSSTSSQFDASSSFLGYLYQARLALLLTLRKTKRDPGLQVSIERFDDVSFDNSGTPLERIQTKHHIGTKGSLTDRSSDLWRTLRIWSEEILKGDLDPTSIILTLVTTSVAPENTAASYLRAAGRDEREASRILFQVAKAGGNIENESGYAAFRQLNRADRAALLAAINVLDAAPSISGVEHEIEDELFYVVDRKHLSGFLERVEGWWFRKVIQQLHTSERIPIFGQQVEAEIEELREQYHADNLTIDFFSEEPPEGTSPESDSRLFVEQLRLISVMNTRIADAIRDYYRAFQQRSLWLREDQIVVEELERYEERLIEEWKRYRDSMIDELSPTSDENTKARLGRDLYNWAQFEADIPIRPRCREPYVLRGSYHMLSDVGKVGWHPEFLERLKKILSGASTA